MLGCPLTHPRNRGFLSRKYSTFHPSFGFCRSETEYSFLEANECFLSMRQRFQSHQCQATKDASA